MENLNIFSINQLYNINMLIYEIFLFLVVLSTIYNTMWLSVTLNMFTIIVYNGYSINSNVTLFETNDK